MTEKEHETNNKKRYASTTITLLYMGWWQHTHKGYIYKERGREGETFAKPAGKGEIILNAVGRLSNLYLFIKKGGPTGANG
jgi:hypothetical protein